MAPAVAAAPPAVPRFFQPAGSNASQSVVQQQLIDLQMLLGTCGLHGGSPVDVPTIATLLPRLPGGAVPTLLARSVWLHLLRSEFGPEVAQQIGSDLSVGVAGKQGPSDGLAAQLDAGAFCRFFAAHIAGTSGDERLVRCLCGSAVGALSPVDFLPLTTEVVRRHPSLNFLAKEDVYRSHYEHTVTQRILFVLDPLRTALVTAAQLRRAGRPLWLALRSLESGEAVEDINLERRFFSYEQFYVIFCKFVELDHDQDFELSLEELQSYDNYSLSTRAVTRIFLELASQALPCGGLGFAEFVFFLLCEEDKASPTAASFWFRILDMDADGKLSAHEMQFFYEEQASRVAALGHEAFGFADILCQLTDAINPRSQPSAPRGSITLADLKRSRMVPLLVNTLTNVTKLLRSEVSDMHALREAQATPYLSDFDRWARAEYAKCAEEDEDEDEDDDIEDDDEYELAKASFMSMLVEQTGCGVSRAQEAPF